MSAYLYEIEHLPYYLWRSAEKQNMKIPVAERGLTMYVHRVQNIWHILYWMYTHQEYCQTGFYMAQYCVHVLMRKLADVGEAEYEVILKYMKNLKGMHGNGTCHTSSAFSDMIVSSIKENMPANLLKILKMLSNMKDAEKHLAEGLSESNSNDHEDNVDGVKMFWEIVKRIKNTALNIPEVLVEKCHVKFAKYLSENFEKMQNSKSEVYKKCKEIYYDSNWFEMGFEDMFSRFTLYLKENNEKMPPVDMVKKWLQQTYHAKKTWFTQLKFMLNSIEPYIMERYSSETLGHSE